MIWTKNVKFHHSRRHVATNYQCSSCVIRHSSEFFVPNSLNGFLTANLQLKPFLMRLEQFTVNASTDGSVESLRSCIMSLLSIMWTQLWIITWARCLFLVLEWLTGWCQVALQTNKQKKIPLKNGQVQELDWKRVQKKKKKNFWKFVKRGWRTVTQDHFNKKSLTYWKVFVFKFLLIRSKASLPFHTSLP